MKFFVAYEVNDSSAGAQLAVACLHDAGHGPYVAGECRGASYEEAFALAARIHGQGLDRQRVNQ